MVRLELGMGWRLSLQILRLALTRQMLSASVRRMLGAFQIHVENVTIVVAAPNLEADFSVAGFDVRRQVLRDAETAVEEEADLVGVGIISSPAQTISLHTPTSQ